MLALPSLHWRHFNERAGNTKPNDKKVIERSSIDQRGISTMRSVSALSIGDMKCQGKHRGKHLNTFNRFGCV